jgi:hypothetical protein
MIPLVIVLPWLIRSYHVFHRPVFLRDNLGLELAVSNNDRAQFSYALNSVAGGCFANNHPNESYREARRAASLGEPAYNQLRLHEALNWIGNNRPRFLRLTIERFTAFWFPNATGNPLYPGNVSREEQITTVFTLLSLPGLVLIWRMNRYAAGLLVLWLTCFPLVFYFVQFEARYRYPILWATLLPGSYVIYRAFLQDCEESGLRVPESCSNPGQQADPVSRSEPSTSVHSSNGRLLVTRVGLRS